VGNGHTFLQVLKVVYSLLVDVVYQPTQQAAQFTGLIVTHHISVAGQGKQQINVL
jgi:hypothetical protein